jgi:hypothetical protein
MNAARAVGLGRVVVEVNVLGGVSEREVEGFVSSARRGFTEVWGVHKVGVGSVKGKCNFIGIIFVGPYIVGEVWVEGCGCWGGVNAEFKGFVIRGRCFFVDDAVSSYLREGGGIKCGKGSVQSGRPIGVEICVEGLVSFGEVRVVVKPLISFSLI